MNRFLWFFSMVIWFSTPIFGQVVTDTLSADEAAKLHQKIDKELRKSERTSSTQISPIIFYTPETRLALGVSAIHRFKFHPKDSLSEYSRIVPSAIFTFNKQVLISAQYDLQLSSKWSVGGELGYFVFLYFFSGIGNDHPVNEWEWYFARYPKFDGKLYREIGVSRWTAGISYRYQNTQVDSIKIGGILDSEIIPGSGGSVQSQAGVLMRYDSRNHLYSPTKGWFAESELAFTESYLGASYSDQIFLLDIRKYIQVSSKKDVLALQIYSEVHGGEVPFNLMPLLGGRNKMRGYRQGVFRDRQMIVYQAEFRSRVFWKHMGMAVFGAIGGVGNDFSEVQHNYRYTTGAGIRYFPIKGEDLVIRLDYGLGNQTQGFYVEVGQAF